MPIKAARASFTRDEAVEILRRNTQLYKDEVGFVDYIVDLTMYILDQHYDTDRISPWEAPEPPGPGRQPMPVVPPSGSEQFVMPPTVAELQGRQQGEGSGRFKPVPAPFSAPPPPVSTRTPLPVAERTSDPASPSSARIKISGVFAPSSVPAASPSAVRQEVEIDPQSGRLRISQENSPLPISSQLQHGEPSSRMEVAASPLMTPPEGALRERRRPPVNEPIDPEIDEPNPGSGEFKMPAVPPIAPRTEKPPAASTFKRPSYQMFRTAKSSSRVELPCPSCGLKVAMGTKQCPGCGQFIKNP